MKTKRLGLVVGTAVWVGLAAIACSDSNTPGDGGADGSADGGCSPTSGTTCRNADGTCTALQCVGGKMTCGPNQTEVALVPGNCVVSSPDAGPDAASDAATTDAASGDGGGDASSSDASSSDASSSDGSSSTDAGSTDAGSVDASSTDAASD